MGISYYRCPMSKVNKITVQIEYDDQEPQTMIWSSDQGSLALDFSEKRNVQYVQTYKSAFSGAIVGPTYSIITIEQRGKQEDNIPTEAATQAYLDSTKVDLKYFSDVSDWDDEYWDCDENCDVCFPKE